MIRAALASPALPVLLLPCLLLAFSTALSSCASDSVNDRRAGQVIVCHKGKKTISVSNASSFGHLDHGDSPGPCANEQ